MRLKREQRPAWGSRHKPGGAAGESLAGFGSQVIRWRPELELVARHVATRYVRELEALATFIFVATDPKERLQSATPDLQSARVRELKPHLAPEEVQQACREYERLLHLPGAAQSAQPVHA